MATSENAAEIDLYDNIDDEDFAQEGNEQSDLYDDVIVTTAGGDSSLDAKGGSGKTNAAHAGKRVATYVGNLTWWTTDQDLTDAVTSLSVSDILEIKFHENRQNGQSKGFCVMVFGSDQSARHVMEKLPKLEIHGQPPMVTFCNKHNLTFFENAAGGTGSGGSTGGGSGSGGQTTNNNDRGGGGSGAVSGAAGGGGRRDNDRGGQKGQLGSGSRSGSAGASGGGTGAALLSNSQSAAAAAAVAMAGLQSALAASAGGLRPPQLVGGGAPPPQLAAAASMQPPRSMPSAMPPNFRPPQPGAGAPPGFFPPTTIAGAVFPGMGLPPGMHHGLAPGQLHMPVHGGPPQGMFQLPPGMPPGAFQPPGGPPPGLPQGFFLPPGVQMPAPHLNPNFLPPGHPGGPPPNNPAAGMLPPGGPHQHLIGGPPGGPMHHPGHPMMPPQQQMPQQGPGGAGIPPGMQPGGMGPPPPTQFDAFGRPIVQTAFPPGMAPTKISDAEFDEILQRNKIVSSSAINRAVQDAASGDYASAIETLVTAISLIKQSKIANDDRCRILINSLQDTLHGIESKSYGSKRSRRRRSYSDSGSDPEPNRLDHHLSDADPYRNSGGQAAAGNSPSDRGSSRRGGGATERNRSRSPRERDSSRRSRRSRDRDRDYYPSSSGGGGGSSSAANLGGGSASSSGGDRYRDRYRH